ncbi:MAG: response regulator [Thermoproteota archaeon]|nr:response regulator [Thermoproteota archaeon]
MLSNSQSILVVDDEPDIVEPIKLWLQRRGLEVHAFTDPLIALEYFKNNTGKVDMVLSDIRMPQMNGYELVKRIKNLQGGVRVILMSAFEINLKEMARVLPDVKIDSLISKPISLRDLTKELGIDLNKSRSNRKDREK